MVLSESVLLRGLQLPGPDHCVLYGIGVSLLEIRDHHHVLREPLRHREGLGERVEQQVSKLERCTNDDVAAVELPRHQTAAIPPGTQPIPTTLGDTLELGGQVAEVSELHRVIVARRSNAPAGVSASYRAAGTTIEPAALSCQVWFSPSHSIHR